MLYIHMSQPADTVQKTSGPIQGDKVHIYIGPSDFNKVIKQEHHRGSHQQNTWGQGTLHKLDTKIVFLQIKLDEAGSLLTTFSMPLFRYRWLILLFRIKCAPEIFQINADQILTCEGLKPDPSKVAAVCAMPIPKILSNDS